MNGELTWIIGRSSRCDIRFEDATVSCMHAKLTRMADGRWLLADLASTNGTRASGHKIVTACLSSGDIVEFGRVRIEAGQLLQRAQNLLSGQFPICLATVSPSWGNEERTMLIPPEDSASAAPYTNSIGMEFVQIPAGTFLMGSGDEAPMARDDEKPRHEVTIFSPFYSKRNNVL